LEAEDRAKAWLAASEPGSLADGLALCADLHVRGKAKLASRVLATLTPALEAARGLRGFEKERLEIVLELEQLRMLPGDHRELVTALARAALAGDNDAIDDALPTLLREGRAANAHLFVNLPHLRKAYEDATSLHWEKTAISSKAQAAIVVFAVGVLFALWDLWPAIKYYLGIRP
jgi:hypothetical protein